MEVKLISHTPDPEFLAGRAAAICTGGNLCDRNACLKALKGALASGHGSVVEHVVYTFYVEGLSRVTLAQLTRHRVASYSVESQRYVENSGQSCVVPDTIAADPELAAAFEALLGKAAIFYEDCISKGVPAEDARYGFLQAGQTRLILTMNARELLHLFSMRCCSRAQWEIRALVDRMLELCRPTAPVIFKNAGPGCVRGGCPEGKRSCGHPWKK